MSMYVQDPKNSWLLLLSIHLQNKAELSGASLWSQHLPLQMNSDVKKSLIIKDLFLMFFRAC